ncbi:hypothetical protein [Blastococcus mobilis]|uniref:Uncharacterized protein n=1 Tax=Blastococcus mobilis TaxID=1938746 RepID=A0A239AZG1_9ACTN|nr:hypothetical protein [Blastococcus mobilis]SNS00378.1 hypothetical protein SAMN06272737_1643 [Blastococcus mobilis]
MIATSGGIHYKDLGANHHMWTDAYLEDDGRIHGSTRTATFTLFGGFTGGCRILVFDANMILLDVSPENTYGVDGKWIGTNDRTDYWEHYLDLGRVGGAVTLRPAQYWAPTWRHLGTVIEIGKQVAPAILALL